MKKIKISLIAVIAIFMGIAGSAFTSSTSKVDGVEEAWFIIQDATHPELAASYSYLGNTTPCAGETELCAIKGTRDAMFPTRPQQTDVDNAELVSSGFTHPVEGLVRFTDL